MHILYFSKPFSKAVFCNDFITPFSFCQFYIINFFLILSFLVFIYKPRYVFLFVLPSNLNFFFISTCVKFKSLYKGVLYIGFQLVDLRGGYIMLGKHFLGLYEKALPPEMDWMQRLSTVKELGYDYMEISIDEKDERIERLYWSDKEKEELHRAISETGVQIPSMCLSCHRRFPYGSADPSIREKAHEIMEKAIIFSRKFGIRVIQLAGYDVYYEESTDESLKYFLEGLRSAAKLAEQYQVMLAMEIMDTELMSSITRYKYYKDNIPSSWFTVYPDLGNLTAWETT